MTILPLIAIQLLISFLALHIGTSTPTHTHRQMTNSMNVDQHLYSEKDHIMGILFPNRTNLHQNKHSKQNLRQLGEYKG